MNIKERFMKLQLKQKIHVLFLFILMAYLLVFILLYTLILKDGMEQYVEENNYNTMVSINNNLQTDFETISTMGKLIIQNPEVIEYLKSDTKDETELSFVALSSIYNIVASYNNIDSVFLFKNNNQKLDITNGLTKFQADDMDLEEWKELVRKEQGANAIMIEGNGIFYHQGDESIITFARVVNDLQTQKEIGVLVINCSMNMLKDTYKKMELTENGLAFYDLEGRLLCGNGVDIIHIPTFDMTNKVVSTQMNPTTIESFLETDDAPIIINSWGNVNYIKYFGVQSIIVVLLFVFVTLLSFFGIGMFMRVFISTPIEKLVGSMDEVKQGWLKRVSIQLPDDELGQLKDSYNNMLIEINGLINKVVEKEKATQRAELEVLQEQIKPHFLYNTLETIGYLALDNHGDAVYDAIETLGKFYRKFLSKGSKEITILEEVEIARSYLKLQKLRYEDVFEDEYYIQNSLLNVKVPKLILQPLVENSLYHGVRLKGELCKIRITITEEREYIAIKVYDTGIGMKRQQILNFMNEDSKSFGLRKTIERIQYFYGINDVYEIDSQEGYYCEILLKIPKKEGLLCTE